jgi:hypothetical protein
MVKVQLRDEVLFKAPTRVGLLAEVTERLNAAGVNIFAIGAYDKGEFGEFLMLTSNNRTTAEALAPLGGTLDIIPVVVVEAPNEPGELAAISRRIADAGLNISQVYATTVDGAPTARIVLTTDDEIGVEMLLEGL